MNPYDHSRAAAIIFETIQDSELIGNQNDEAGLAMRIAVALLEEGCLNKSAAALTKKQKAKHGNPK